MSAPSHIERPAITAHPLLTGAAAIAGALALAAGSEATGIVASYTFLHLSLALVMGIAVLGLNVVTGYAGQISLGHGAFFAIGAYAMAMAVGHAAAPIWIALPLAAIVCFCAGFAFARPILRLEGPYLALATFALAIAVPQALKYRHLEPLTGGATGLHFVKPDAPFGLPLSPDRWLFVLVVVVAVVAFGLVRNVVQSGFGRSMMAIRENETAARALGIDTARVKGLAFALSASVTGVAGALHALLFEFVSPDSYRFDLSLAIFVGGVVGGIATLPGALVGGAFVHLVHRYADTIARALSDTLELPLTLQPAMIYGIVLIGLVYLAPSGLYGAARDGVRCWWMSRPSVRRNAAPPNAP
jgi:branched-chain amino acid transport system permease protein